MRIGIIAPPWLSVPPRAYGGTETVIDVLARGLQRQGHEVVLAAAADSRCPVPQLPGAPRPDEQHVGRVQDELRHVLNAYTHLQDAHLIHDHTLAGPLLKAPHGRTPVVCTAHNSFEEDFRSVYAAIAQQASLLAISRHQARTAAGIRIARVIHHGIDATDIPLGAGQGGYACFLGRMHPNKGVLTAIHIAKRARVPLRIAAKMTSADEIAYFKEAIKPELGADIEFLGEVGAQEKFRLLGDAFALLNPIQWSEPFGMVMLESLATGTPVLSTARGSAPEIITEGLTGFLRDTPRALAEILPESVRLNRAQCRHATETTFSSERMVDEHVDFYEKCLSKDLGHHPVRV